MIYRSLLQRNPWKSRALVAIISKACQSTARSIKVRALYRAFEEKWMLRDRWVAVFLAGIFLAAGARTQTLPTGDALSRPADDRSARVSETLASPSAADRFWEIGYEIAQRETLTGPEADQGIILLTAAKSLNSRAGQAEALLLRLATRQAGRDYSKHIMAWLQDYVGQGADRGIISDAIAYLLERRTSVQDRRKLLEELVSRIGNKNAAVDSELATLLGLLMVEKGDAPAAKFYMLQAYTSNKFNPVAFAKLAELAPDEIGPAAYLEHLRLLVRENPLNLDAAMNFAQYSERLQFYDMAAGAFQYCAQLFRHLNPDQPLPPEVYLPWALAGYHSTDSREICGQIADSVHAQGRFDFLLEAIAGRAALRAGDTQEAQRVFGRAEEQAQAVLQGRATAVRELDAKQVAWFYCLAAPDPEKALEWANSAYAVEPNSPPASALLAYALSMNDGQLEWVKPLLASFEHNQIADIVQAKIQLVEGDSAGAVKTLQTAVAKDPASFAAERAMEMLREQGSPYAPPVDTAAVTDYLIKNLGQPLVPQFTPPEATLEVQLNIRGNEFSYGREIDATIAIGNKGPEPLVITENGLFTGLIRVDARVTGDLSRSFPNLISQTIRTELLVPGGRSLVAPVRLSVGPLHRMLLDHPQASLTVEFTLYADPVPQSESVRNRLAGLEPVKVSISRPGVELTAGYIRNRHSSITSGQQDDQAIRTAQLFTGLLKERQVMAKQGTLYSYMSAQWLGDLLRSSLVGDPGLLLADRGDRWDVTVNTMAHMLSMSMDQDVATAVARNLNHPKWPVRLMAVYLLATTTSGSNFGDVLDWVGENDSSDLVRSMATTLQSTRLDSAAR